MKSDNIDDSNLLVSCVNHNYQQWGMAAVIPGLQKAIDILQEQLDNIRIQLHAAMGRTVSASEEPVVVVAPPRGRRKPKLSAIAKYWARFPSDEARSREMKRRQQVAAEKKKAAGKLPVVKVAKAKPAKMHPRDPRHPGHDAWIATMRKARKKAWKGMTVREQKGQLARMQAGRAKPNGAAAAA